MGEDPVDRRGRPVRGHEFFTAAERYFSSHVPQARIVHLPPGQRTFVGLMEWLRGQPGVRVGQLYLVTHAATEGLVIPFEEGDATRGTSYAELNEALASRPALFRLGGQVDAGTTIEIRGCNIGRNGELVEAVRAAFGAGTIHAPTHRTHYQFTPEGETREYFVDYRVERPGDWRASRNEVRDALQTRYPQLTAVWANVRRRVRRRVVRERMSATLAGPVSDAELIATARRRIGDAARYDWTVKRRGRVATVVLTRTEYVIAGEITGARAGDPTYVTERRAPRPAAPAHR